MDRVLLSNLRERRRNYETMTYFIVPIAEANRGCPQRNLRKVTWIFMKALVDREGKVHAHENPIRFDVLCFADLRGQQKKYYRNIS
jgi:hypothetical protein